MNLDPLVLNADTERYSAPIRPDPRPLFGIFHATFVLARMYRVLSRWAVDGGPPAVADAAEDALRRFRFGLRTLSEHGKLTDRGDQVVESLSRLVGEPYTA